MSIIQAIRAQDPVHCISEEELDRAFLVFCSYMCVLHNKKLNLANIFLLLLKSENIKNLFKGMTDLDSDYDCVRYFLERDPSLHKSKYIKNYITQRDNDAL
jgi:hypothetical protein